MILFSSVVLFAVVVLSRSQIRNFFPSKGSEKKSVELRLGKIDGRNQSTAIKVRERKERQKML